MFADILKALEVLQKVLTRNPDAKRSKFAKELLRLYVDSEAVVARGREIVSEIAPGIVNSEPKPRLIKLLSEQISAIESIEDRLSRGKLRDVLQVHFPLSSSHLQLLADDMDVVVFVLDQLADGRNISNGRELSLGKESEEILSRDTCPGLFPFFSNRSLAWVVWESSKFERFRLYATPEGMQRIREILDRITSINEELRMFLVKQFKLEDIL